MPTYITLGNLRIAGVAAMWQGKGSWTCQSALGRRRRSCRSADAPPDCIMLGPQPIGPERPPALEHQFHLRHQCVQNYPSTDSSAVSSM